MAYNLVRLSKDGLTCPYIRRISKSAVPHKKIWRKRSKNENSNQKNKCAFWKFCNADKWLNFNTYEFRTWRIKFAYSIIKQWPNIDILNKNVIAVQLTNSCETWLPGIQLNSNPPLRWRKRKLCNYVLWSNTDGPNEPKLQVWLKRGWVSKHRRWRWSYEMPTWLCIWKWSTRVAICMLIAWMIRNFMENKLKKEDTSSKKYKFTPFEKKKIFFNFFLNFFVL